MFIHRIVLYIMRSAVSWLMIRIQGQAWGTWGGLKMMLPQFMSILWEHGLKKTDDFLGYLFFLK